MNNNLIMILQSINTIHQLEEELSKRFGWLRFKEKKECKELKNKILESINSLYNDRWTVEYIKSLQNILETFYIVIEDYIGPEIYILEYEEYVKLKEKSSDAFAPMYFMDEKNKNHIITLSVVSNNITFTIMDTDTGNSFSTSSTDEVQSSQKKIESVCKHCLVKLLTRFLNSDKNQSSNATI